MQKLRGTGTTFSTSGRQWLPFHYDPAKGRKAAKLNRLKRKGLTLPADKNELRAAGLAAIACHPIKRID